jgi:fructose-specific phosphotransferase system IIC component
MMAAIKPKQGLSVTLVAYYPCYMHMYKGGVVMTTKKVAVILTGTIISYVAGEFTSRMIDKSEIDEYEKYSLKVTVCPFIGFIVGLIMRAIIKRK